MLLNCIERTKCLLGTVEERIRMEKEICKWAVVGDNSIAAPTGGMVRLNVNGTQPKGAAPRVAGKLTRAFRDA